MERQPRFDLTAATEAWLDTLRQRGTLTDDDLRELQSHLLDSLERLKATGLSEEEAFLISRRRLGSIEVIGQEFGKINRTVVVQRESLLVLIGLLSFLILRNCLETVTAFAASGLASRWGNSRTTLVLDAGLCFFLLLAVVLGSYRLVQNGRKVQEWFFRRLFPTPVGLASGMALLLGLSALGAYFAELEFEQLVQPPADSTHAQIRQIHGLFWLGFYLNWPLIFLNTALQHTSGSSRNLLGWLEQTSVGWLIVSGLCLFTGCLGLFVAGMRVLVPIETASRFFISASVCCLVSGFVLVKNSRYPWPVRFLVILAPIAIWYGLAAGKSLFFDPTPSVVLSRFFALKFFGSSIAGAAAGLVLNIRRTPVRNPL